MDSSSSRSHGDLGRGAFGVRRLRRRREQVRSVDRPFGGLEALEPRLLLAANPVGYWTFNNAGSLGADSSGNGNNLTAFGGVTQNASGRFGGALLLDGVDDYLGGITPTGLPTGNSQYTISAWIKPDTTTLTTARGIVGWGNYGASRQVNALRLRGLNGFRHYWWAADLDASDAQVTALGADLDGGQWHHIVATYDGTTRSLWLNGQPLVSDTPGANGATGANFAVGRTYPAGNEYFDGSLDDVAVWNVALAANQIAALYSGASPLSLPEAGDTLIAQWTADGLAAGQGDGTVVTNWIDGINASIANATGQPRLETNEINGHAVVRFNPADGNDLLRVPAVDSPMTGINDFSIAVVFRTSTAGLAGADWYQNTGLVDAEQPGVTSDWGLVLNNNGAVGAGLGNPDRTLYSSQTGLADGRPHVAIYTRQGGTLRLNIDGQDAGSRTDGGAATRGAFDMVFGAIQTGTGFFTGDIAEIRIYGEPLSGSELDGIATELMTTYGITGPEPPSGISVAGTLLVDLRATHPSAATSVWDNGGTLGDFTRIGNPQVQTIAGVTAVALNFDNPAAGWDDAYLGPLAPAAITGAGTRSIEIWAYNPNDGLQNLEETAVAWGRRGGPEGSNLSFGYGNSGTWGAVGHWGNPDMPWFAAGGSPALGQWHHLVYTYDGSVTRLYSDGVLTYSEVVGTLSTHAGTTINLGAQNGSGGTLSLTEGQAGSLALANVRIHTGVLTAVQIQGNYAAGIQTSLDPPTAMNDVYDADEDMTLNVNAAQGVLANDNDPQMAALTAILVTDVQHGTLTLNTNGSFIYIPDPNYHGPDSFTYQASNGGTLSNLATVTIDVASVYDPPVANPDQYVTAQNVDLVVNAANGVLANDANPDEAVITVELIDDVDHGMVTLNADGSFSYDPQPTFKGTDSFTYRVLDGGSNSNVATVTIHVDAPPVANDDAYDVPEDGFRTVVAAEGVLVNDTDEEMDHLTASLVTNVQHGVLIFNANGSFTYMPFANYSGPDSFTYRANDGDQYSNVATVTLMVTPTNDAPDAQPDIYFGEQNQTLFVGAASGVLANDVDPDGPALSAVLETPPDAGMLTLFANGSFSYVPPAGFIGVKTFTYRATDTIETTDPIEVTIVINDPNPRIVINEINVDPPDTTVPAEFIELYNAGDAPVNLSGWRFSDGVDYTFPLGTILAAGGYLVIAENPQTILNVYGVAALGPWQGSLNNDGETIELRNAANNVIDFVDYGQAYPWPTSAFGDGPSMELVNPSLDNELGGSWRSSTGGSLPINPVTLLPLQSSWRYRKGTSEASNPISAWRLPGFVMDGTWLTGQTPIGYGDGDDNTVLADMQNNYTSVYMRNTFDVGATEPDTIKVRAYFDDGAIIWINGVEVARFNVSAGDKFFNSTTGTTDHEASFQDVIILNASGLLNPGVNTIAVHAMNVTIGSSDLSIDVEVMIPGMDEVAGQPTPGARNSVYADNAPPQTRQVRHSPQTPTSGQPSTITIKVTDPDGVASVMLEYQIVAPGNYIPAYLPLTTAQLLADPTMPQPANPAYWNPANWTSVQMFDDGTHGDAVAGDDIYTAILPGQVNRTIVRYRVNVEDTLGASVTVPYSDDPSLNFAYYVYDGVPDWNGFDGEDLASLPTYHLITRPQDLSQAIAYNAADQIPQFSGSGSHPARYVENWEGAIYYDGTLYDHVEYRLRGANGRYQGGGKRSFRFYFNKGNYLQAKDQDGNPYPTKWRQLETYKGQSNRLTLTYGFNEVVNYYLWNQTGTPAPHAFFFHFRVVDGVDENPAIVNGQYFGDFWGLNVASEPYDVRFLESHGLEKGNLYKLINSTLNPLEQQRYQAPNAVSNGADFNNIENNLRGTQSIDWLLAHVNYDQWFNYHALSVAIRSDDYWPSANKNATWYFEPIYTPENNFLGRMWTLPWDTDSTWGPRWNPGHDRPYDGIFPSSATGGDPQGHPAMQLLYRNAVRNMRDLLFQQDQIEPLLWDFADDIDQFVPADRARWLNAPAAAGNYNHLTNLFTLEQYVQDMLNFAFVGGNWPGGGVGPGGQAAVMDSVADAADAGLLPDKPIAAYIGPANYPTNALTFQTSSFSDPQGAGTFAALEWRIARITDPLAPAYNPDERFKLEFNAEWESGEITTFADEILIPATAVQVGHTYRVRVRMKDNTGRWGHWSDPVQFTTTTPDVTPLIDALRVTEVMYHPLPPQPGEPATADDNDFEFIEIRNVSAQPVNLVNVKFTQGITFDFSTSLVTLLEPGAYVVVVNDLAAFTARYGPNLPVAGEYGGNLNNAGERIVLSFGADVTLIDFTYDDSGAWPGRPDGNGSSLEAIDPNGNLNSPANWRAGYELHGSPGATGLGPRTDIVINEVLTNTTLPDVDAIELHNTSGVAVDLSGWWLSDNFPNVRKYQIPAGTVILPGGYVVFTEEDFNPGNGTLPDDFALSSLGDDLWLMAALDGGRLGFVDDVNFDAAPPGESFGRYPNGAGPLVPMQAVTLNNANSNPRIGPVIISEFMYQPPDPGVVGVTANDMQFIELYNSSTAAIDLTDWEINGVGFDFNLSIPATTMIESGQVLVIVFFDPTLPANATKLNTFRSVYGIDGSVPLIGAADGQLSDNGERVRLERAGEPTLDDPPVIPLYIEDEVDYLPVAPWPNAAGNGSSLIRIALDAFGNDPASWTASTPTPGSVPFPPPGIPGDFNFDTILDATDIDMLLAEIVAGTHTPLFDLTDDGLVTQTDADHWVRVLMGTQYGDANLDRRVNITDLSTVAVNFGGPGGWAKGNFNGRDGINISDLSTVAVYFGFNNSGGGGGSDIDLLAEASDASRKPRRQPVVSPFTAVNPAASPASGGSSWSHIASVLKV